MALNVSGLTDYVNIHRDELFIKATAGAKSLDYVEVMGDVKWKDALQYLDSTIVLADGSVCGFNPQGSDVFSERYIETKAVKVEKEFCGKDFEKKAANYQLRWEAGRETLPFEEKIALSNMNAIQDALEHLVWRGEASLEIDGWLAQATAETLVTDVTWASGSTTIAKVDAMVANIPAKALAKGVRIFMSPTDFRNYVAEQNASCCANRPIIDANVESLKYIGDSRIELVPVAGLEPANSAETNYMVAATEDALVYGTDIENSENVYKFWFNEEDEKFKFRVLFRAGTAIKHPEEVVLGTQA